MSYSYTEVTGPKGAPLLLLLHGTGGDENDLLDLGRTILPEGHLLAPRGDVSENGAPRFFRRLGPGVYDMADLARATEKLATFLTTRIAEVQPSAIYALGYSNGANILASLLFKSPQLIDKAVLMHPLIPFDPNPQPGLSGRGILITAGRQDPIAPAAQTERLLAYFASQGASTTVAWHGGGHEIRREELAAARELLAVAGTVQAG